MIEFDYLIEKLVTNLSKIPYELPKIFEEEVNKLSSEIEDLNISQLQSGIDSEGENIKPDYMPFTKSIKRAKGQPTDRVTLKDEGDFYKSITYKADAKGIEYKATDIKTNDLEEKYGENILGLTNENIENIVDLIEDGVIEQVNNILK